MKTFQLPSPHFGFVPFKMTHPYNPFRSTSGWHICGLAMSVGEYESLDDSEYSARFVLSTLKCICRKNTVVET